MICKKMTFKREKNGATLFKITFFFFYQFVLRNRAPSSTVPFPILNGFNNTASMRVSALSNHFNRLKESGKLLLWRRMGYIYKVFEYLNI